MNSRIKGLGFLAFPLLLQACGKPAAETDVVTPTQNPKVEIVPSSKATPPPLEVTPGPGSLPSEENESTILPAPVEEPNSEITESPSSPESEVSPSPDPLPSPQNPPPAEITEAPETPETPEAPEAPAEPSSSSFSDVFGSCENQSNSVFRILVKLKSLDYFTSLGLNAAQAANRRQAAVDRFQSYPISQVRFISSIDTFVFQMSILEDQLAIASELYATGDYEFIRKDCLRSPSLTPNDPQYANQAYLPVIGAPAAWDITTGSSSVTIAVLDTGVDGSSAEFLGKIVPGFNTITCSSTALPGCGTATPVITADPCGNHGTWVAAVAGAIGNNAIGMAGISWGSQIMPVRVTNAADCTTPSSELAQGIIWASENGARVINVSYSGVYDPTIQDAAQQARRNGSITVFSAGNNSSDIYNLCVADFGTAVCNTITLPDVLVVGATDNGTSLANFSNYGNLVDMVAPGVSIRTFGIGGTFSDVNGTSFSAPIVSGAAALLLSLRPSLSPQDVQHYLLESSLDLGTAGKDSTFGMGRLRIDTALNLALAGNSSSSLVANRKLDFLIPRGPVKMGIADQQVRGSADSQMFVFSQGNAGLISVQAADAFYRDVTMSSLPENVSMGRSSLFYRKNDTTPDFVFTDQNRTRVYLGSTTAFGTSVTEPPIVNSRSCGPFQEISAIHLTASATGVTSHLIVADKRANTVYSYTLDPDGTNLCTNAQTTSITSPLWIRSVSGVNPRIYIGYRDSSGLKIRAYQDSNLTATSAAQLLTGSSTAQFGTPIVDTTNSELWVPIALANDSVADDYLMRFDFAAYPPATVPAYSACQSPTQIVQDYEGASRYLYILCPAAKQIQILNSTYDPVGSIQLDFSPRKMHVSSDGTNRYLALLRSDTKLTLYQSPVASPPQWTTHTIAVPAVMDDIGAFAAFNQVVLTSMNSNLLSFVNLGAMSLNFTFSLPQSIDALAVQSSFTSHFVSSATNSAYTLEELNNGAWKLRQYPVGTFPNQIRYRTNRLYVTNRDSNNFSVINLGARTVANIATQTRPTLLEINAATNRAWVGNETSQSVSTYNITPGSEGLISHTGLGFVPKKIKYQSSDNTVYISGPTQIRALDGTSLATLATQSISSGVSDIDLITGGVWATSKSGLSASAMTRSTFTTTTLNSSPNHLSSNQSVGVVGLSNLPGLKTSAGNSWSVSSFNQMFSTLSNLFLTTTGSRSLQIYPYSQMGSTSFAGLSLPTLFDVDRWDSDITGNLWIANASQLKVQRIDASAQMQNLSNRILNRAVDLTSYPTANRVYFLMRNMNAIFVYDTVNARLSAFSTCQAPSKIIFDINNTRLWVLCTELNSLAAINLDNLGDPSSQTFVSTGLRPIDWALNAVNNSLYLVNQKSNSIYRFNASNPSATPTAIAVGVDPKAVAVDTTLNRIDVFHETLRTRSSINGADNAVSTNTLQFWGFQKAATNSSTGSVYAIAPSPPSVFYTGNALNFLPSGAQLTDYESVPSDLGVSIAQDKTYIPFANANVVKILSEIAGTSVDLAVGSEPRNVYVSDSVNRAYVANFAGDTVSVISTTTNALLATVSLPTGCGPTRMLNMSVGGTPMIFVLCENTDTASVFNATTYAVSTPVNLRLP